MPIESTMDNLQLDRAVLKRQIDELSGHMQETKTRRQDLETQHKDATLRLSARIASGDGDEVAEATNRLAVIEPELLAVEERLQSMNQRMQMLQREHAMTGSEMRRTEVAALGVASRIRLLRSDLTRMQHKQDANSPLVVNAIRSIQADLRVSERKYVGLVGEVFPDEAA